MSLARKLFISYNGYALITGLGVFGAVTSRHLTVPFAAMAATGLVGILCQFILQRRKAIPWTSRASLILLLLPIMMAVMTVVAFVYMRL